jgi:hypothetical protein
MDLWQMVLADHANIEELCREVMKASPSGPNSRAELFADLEDELDGHLRAKENVLYPALEHDSHTETYLFELNEEHKDIRRRLAALSRHPDKNSRQWALDFNELAGVIRHAFSLEENGLLVTAHGVVHPREAETLRRAYEREKMAFYESSRWHLPQAMMPSRYGMPTGMTFGILAGLLAMGGAAVAWNMTRQGRTAYRSNAPLHPARRRPEPPFPLESGVIDRSLSRGGMEGRASTGARATTSRSSGAMSSDRMSGRAETGMERDMTGRTDDRTAEHRFSSANPPHAPSGLSTPLQPGGTVPGGAPASSVGSVGTGGGQTENRDTGSLKREGP